MALLQSPGVQIREIDNSTYTTASPTTVFGVVGTASKGPTNRVTLITNEAQLVGAFGQPSASHIGLLAAIRYLRFGNQLKFVRVAEYDSAATGVLRNSGGSADAVDLTCIETGSWGNGISVQVANGVIAGTYKIIVKYNGVVVEMYDHVYVGAAYVSNANYIETRINGRSNYITVTADPTQSTLKLATATVGGGQDGTPLDDSVYIGTAGAPPAIPATGLQLFANPETQLLDLVAVPGRYHAAVLNALITLAETRRDVFALLDIPPGMSISEIVDWHNGVGGGPYDPSAALNSSYAGIFYPWVTIHDSYSGSDVSIPACGHVAGVMAYTDYVVGSWFAPAGLQRARLTDLISIEYSANQGDRDFMYGYGNSVNPIIADVHGGFTVWGQRTLWRSPTALDRINVRRMMLYVERQCKLVAETFLFQQNDPTTWGSLKRLLERVLEAVTSARGIIDSRVICDGTINDTTSNEVKARVLIQPTKTAEIITLEFTVSADTGVSVV